MIQSYNSNMSFSSNVKKELSEEIVQETVIEEEEELVIEPK